MNLPILATILILVFSSSAWAFAQQSSSDALNNYCQYEKKINPNFVCPSIPKYSQSTAEAKNILKNDANTNQINQAREELRSQYVQQQNHQNTNQSYSSINGSQISTIVIIIIVILIIIVVVSKSHPQSRLPPEIERGLQTNFKNWDSRKFEEMVADLYRRKGYVTTLTPKGPDGGVDIIAKNSREKIVIQAKRWDGTSVGNTDVLKTLGTTITEKATKAVVITNSDFTRKAFEIQQKTANLELINMEKLRDEIKKTYKRTPS